MKKTIQNKYVTPDDIRIFIQNNAQQNSGSVNIKESWESMRRDAPHIQVGLDKYSRLAQTIIEEEHYSIFDPKKIVQKTPMLPKKISKSNSPSVSRSASRQDIENPDSLKSLSSDNFEPTTTNIKFDNVGGLLPQKERLADLILTPIMHRQLFMSAGCFPPRSVLLVGPSGCGKSLLAEAVGGQFSDILKSFFKISATDLLKSSKNYSGQIKDKISALFLSAKTLQPSLIVIDDIDILSKDKDSAIIRSQLIQCLDSAMNDNESFVSVIATTSKIEKVDTSLRRPGRFEYEVSIGLPDYDQRLEILRVVCRNLNLDESVDLEQVAREADGFIGADIVALTKEASLTAVKRFLSAKSQDESNEEGENSDVDVKINNDDFLYATKLVQPTLRREGFTTLPPASFSDIGGLENVKKELQIAVVDAIIRPEIFGMYNHKPSSGVILYGPPGCGKTLLARAIAHEANRAAFISVKGPELLSKFLGESESAVRAVFRRARDSAPCIIFFDEIDAICPKRSEDSSNAAASRVVNQLLTEMDGVVDRGRVFVIGATNRLELIDEAMLRPGRLDKKIEVPKPDKNGRVEILQKQIEKISNREEIDVDSIADGCDDFSGAELDALTSEAIELAIAESSEDNWVPVNNNHYKAALAKLLESRSKKNLI